MSVGTQFIWPESPGVLLAEGAILVEGLVHSPCLNAKLTAHGEPPELSLNTLPCLPLPLPNGNIVALVCIMKETSFH